MGFVAFSQILFPLSLESIHSRYRALGLPELAERITGSESS